VEGIPLRRRQGVSAHHRSQEARLTPFVDAARIYALARQIPDTNTVERLRVSGETDRHGGYELAALIDAFHHIQRLRLEQQVNCAAMAVSNRVNPDDLHELDRLILKESLKQVQNLQKRLAREYLPAWRCCSRCRSSTRAATAKVPQPGAKFSGTGRHLARARSRRRRCRSCRARPRAGSTSRHAPEQVAALAAEIAGGHANDHHLAVKRLGPVLHGRVGDDDAQSLDIEFGVAERLEKARRASETTDSSSALSRWPA
jgi:hypothetical protein